MEAMLSTLVHRGPDGNRTHVEPGVGLGFCRLAIIDLAGGMQPLSNEDGSVQLVFNGEIYNYRALRQELVNRGHTFRTQTDSETIVHAYEEWGAACPERLRGIFAFAVFDRRRRRLLLARDRSGIKPLYLMRQQGELRFASEAKALLADPTVRRRIDVVGCFARHQVEPEFEPTPFASVVQLGPGCTLEVTPEGETHRRYWRYAPSERHEAKRGGPREAALVREFRELLEEAVQSQVMSDVPIGAYLSGGVDSAAIIAGMRRAGVEGIRSYTTVFDDPSSEDPAYSALAARALGTDARFIRCPVSPETLSLLPFIAWMAEGDFDLGFLSRFLLAHAARQDGVKVILTGQGIDEILTGYFPDFDAFEKTSRMADFARQTHGLSRDELTNVLRTERAMAEPPATAAARTARHLRDQHARLSNYLLRFEDRMGMAAGVEVRVPMLDHPLLELCGRIPHASRPRMFSGKHLLRQAVRGWLPRAIAERRKYAFNSGALPITQVLSTLESTRPRNERLEQLRRLLSPKAIREKGYFEEERVEELVERNSFRALDGVLIVQLLDELYVKGRGFRDFVGASPVPVVTPAQRPSPPKVARRREVPVRRVTGRHVPRFGAFVTHFDATFPVDQNRKQLSSSFSLRIGYSVSDRPPLSFAGDEETWKFLRGIDGKLSYAELAERLGPGTKLASVLDLAGLLEGLGLLVSEAPPAAPSR
jgi:asparagine synthase (glutamine-hydrolysing)